MPELLAPFLDAPDRAGVFCDFDGTLATIVLDPTDARPVAGAVEVLDALAERYARVGVISGRPLSFLHQHLRSPDLVLRGLYGLDGHPEAEPWRPAVARAAAEALAHAPDGVHVETKGLSVTVHYRTAPEHRTWVRSWAETASRDCGLVQRPARMSVELLPPLTIDKGTTIAELGAGLDAVCFIGDDLGDLDAFAALDRMRAHGVATMRVAVRSDESPPDLIATADVVVDGPPGTVALLRSLVLPA
jgi:trehalose 6-phosphate phosphatase